MVNLGWWSTDKVTLGLVSRKNLQVPEDAPKFGEWKQIEQRRTEFCKALAELVGKDERLVVFIDELDRCLPARALELLDAVRHLFDVLGVVIVLGINEGELRHRVKQLFGQDCEADVYLCRFVDVSIDLPDPGSELAGFLDDSFITAGLEERLRDGGYSGPVIELLAEQPGMSLRDIEQMVHRVSLVLAHSPETRLDDCQRTRMQATLSLFALRVVARDVYDRFVAGECDGFAAAEGLKDALSDRSIAGSHPVASRIFAMLCHLGPRTPAERTRDQIRQLLKRKSGQIPAEHPGEQQHHKLRSTWKTISEDRARCLMLSSAA